MINIYEPIDEKLTPQKFREQWQKIKKLLNLKWSRTEKSKRGFSLERASNQIDVNRYASRLLKLPSKNENLILLILKSFCLFEREALCRFRCCYFVSQYYFRFRYAFAADAGHFQTNVNNFQQREKKFTCRRSLLAMINVFTLDSFIKHLQQSVVSKKEIKRKTHVGCNMCQHSCDKGINNFNQNLTRL